MQFLNGAQPQYDLTYSDVFLVPQYTDVNSRMNVNLDVADPSGLHIPIVVANMNAVAGKRMAETTARRGGLTILPQDIPLDVLRSTIAEVKKAHAIYETPIAMGPQNTIQDALNLIYKRSHLTVIVVDKNNVPIGIFKEKDALNHDNFTTLAEVMNDRVVTIKTGLAPEKIFEEIGNQIAKIGVIVSEKNKLVGVMTKQSALRTIMYEPLLDKSGSLKVGVAMGVNGDVESRAQEILDAGADVLVVDTAHGDQAKMIKSLKKIRPLVKKTPLVAGNVVTPEATKRLIEAGADIVKVGVGPGAMCTTRMMTGVGRPQFSAILACATEARLHGKHVWADGGIRHPRDVALAIAAGASSAMFASWFAGTYESAGDVLRDPDGKLYKESYGMASKRAVLGRTKATDALERAKKEMFEEGINTSKLYLSLERPGVEDIIDYIVTGLRSSMSYSGATTLEEFYERAVVGIQSGAGYEEGRPVLTSW